MEIQNPKPSPDIFLKAATLLNVQPSECIVIEDSKNGVLAAKSAGMAALGFLNPNSGNQDLSKADYLFESFPNIDEPFIRMVHNHCFQEPWYVLETERLKIREISPSDIDPLIKIYSSPEITQYMEGLFDREQELEYIKQYISNIYGFYGYGMWIIEKKDGTIIGRAGIEYYDSELKIPNQITGTYRPSQFLQSPPPPTSTTISQSPSPTDNSTTVPVHLLGYVIATEHQHQGYALEACTAIINYAINTLGIQELKVNIHKDNTKSVSLAQKLGFKFHPPLNSSDKSKF